MGSLRSKGSTQSIDSAKSDLIPPRFEDFLRPNPFVYPWMLRFLPAGRRIQDYSVVVLGSLLFCIIFIFLYEVGFGELLSFGLGMTGVAVLTGENEARYMIAGAKFGRAKKLFQTRISKVQQLSLIHI